MIHLTKLGWGLVLILSGLALLAPLLAGYDPNAIDVKAILLAPSSTHWMGTDSLGRDVWARMLYGGRISLFVSLVAVGISTFIGVVLGALAGFYRGTVDALIMRLVDVMLSIPSFFLILAVIAFLPPSLFNIMVVIGLTSWMGVARLVRAEFLSLREQEFVLSAVSLGASDWRLMFRHMLPNSLSPIIVSTMLSVAGAVLLESSLSFLGLGVQAPMASWGNILNEGKEYIQFAWWLSLFPGLAILLTVLGYNLIGNGLRLSQNPRTNTSLN